MLDPTVKSQSDAYFEQFKKTLDSVYGVYPICNCCGAKRASVNGLMPWGGTSAGILMFSEKTLAKVQQLQPLRTDGYEYSGEDGVVTFAWGYLPDA